MVGPLESTFLNYHSQVIIVTIPLMMQQLVLYQYDASNLKKKHLENPELIVQCQLQMYIPYFLE